MTIRKTITERKWHVTANVEQIRKTLEPYSAEEPMKVSAKLYNDMLVMPAVADLMDRIVVAEKPIAETLVLTLRDKAIAVLEKLEQKMEASPVENVCTIDRAELVTLFRAVGVSRNV